MPDTRGYPAKNHKRYISLDFEKVAEFLQCSVCIMCKNLLCKNFAELNAFLIETVYIPKEALEHNLVLEV